MKYPKEYLDEIKLRLKVSQVVGKSVQLKKRGKEFVGLSPFKNEKTPSFTVNDEKEFYHCFATGEHGNIFDFLMKTKSMGFGEAVRTLASEAGMQPYRFSNFDENILSLIFSFFVPIGPEIVKFDPSILIEDSFGIEIFFFPIFDIKIPYKLFLHRHFFFWHLHRSLLL